jgi:hypothetical protein
LPCAMGVVLRPGVATRFFGASALDFSGRTVSAGEQDRWLRMAPGTW